MTLAPVFRSQSGVDFLTSRGVVARMLPHLAAQRTAYNDVARLISETFDQKHSLGGAKANSLSETEFLQDHFFLTLFRAFFDVLGAGPRLDAYTRINLTIKGIITAADNIFDGEFKELIPFNLPSGRTFGSIVQLMTFERLCGRFSRDLVRGGLGTAEQADAFAFDFLSRLVAIGTLEGSEEDGVDSVPAPDAMINQVHRVRGGALFALAFAAPLAFEKDTAKWRAAEHGIARLGTAFQIVDDLTDFEFDLHRRSHNLLVSCIMHNGSNDERAALARIRASVSAANGDWEAARPSIFGDEDIIDRHFSRSALEVLHHARREGRLAFEEMQRLGFWFEPADSDEVIHAIVGLEGVHRMERLIEKERGAAAAR